MLPGGFFFFNWTVFTQRGLLLAAWSFLPFSHRAVFAQSGLLLAAWRIHHLFFFFNPGETEMNHEKSFFSDGMKRL